MASDHDSSNSLWEFALQLYEYPGVKPAVLALQDRAGANVNLLLWACWLQNRAQWLDETAINAAHSVIEPLHTQWVLPLRELRCSASDEGLTELKKALLAAELHAEQLVIDRLHEFSRDYEWREPPAESEHNVRNYLRTLAVGKEWDEAISTLEQAAGLAADSHPP